MRTGNGTNSRWVTYSRSDAAVAGDAAIADAAGECGGAEFAGQFGGGVRLRPDGAAGKAWGAAGSDARAAGTGVCYAGGRAGDTRSGRARSLYDAGVARFPQ